jgi:hypothetical protein
MPMAFQAAMREIFVGETTTIGRGKNGEKMRLNMMHLRPLWGGGGKSGSMLEDISSAHDFLHFSL